MEVEQDKPTEVKKPQEKSQESETHSFTHSEVP